MADIFAKSLKKSGENIIIKRVTLNSKPRKHTFFLKMRITVYVWIGGKLACENIRFSSLFAVGDVSRNVPAEKSEEKRMFSQTRGKRLLLELTRGSS